MITEQTVQQVAVIMILRHRLQAPRVAAGIFQALDGDVELQHDWLRITHMIWRTLHRRRAAAAPVSRFRVAPI